MTANVESMRLKAQINKDTYVLLARAAEIKGLTITEFVVSVVEEAAQRVIEESDVLKLCVADQAIFAKALLGLQEPSEALKALFRES